MHFCDLHMHSNASDGTDAPESLPALATAAGLSAIALTDHDTTDGLPACAAACAEIGIDFVPGIELSVDPRPVLGSESDERFGTLHILGYFVQHDHQALLAIRDEVRDARAERNPQIIKNLNRLGMDIDYDHVLDHAGDAVVGRPHIAAVMVEHGYAASVTDAFERFIGEGRPAYARRDPIYPQLAINAIHAAGGLACLAHPIQMRYGDIDHLRDALTKLKDVGLDAMECYHSDHTLEHRLNFERLADEFKLIVTGGSDYHGHRKCIDLGSQQVPYAAFEKLSNARPSTETDEAASH